MALKSHLNALTTRHQDLESTLSTEMKFISRDEQRILELKRQKLRLKDEISKLRRRQN